MIFDSSLVVQTIPLAAARSDEKLSRTQLSPLTNLARHNSEKIMAEFDYQHRLIRN